MNERIKRALKSPLAIPLALIGVLVIYYLCICNVYTVLENRKSEVFFWMMDSWNERNDLLHGYAVPFLFVLFSYWGIKAMRKEPDSSGVAGIFILLIGMLLFVASARTIQPRLALIGLPFIISGSAIYLCGWKAGKHMLFPAFFWYFAIPIPGIQQTTNHLQVIVTQACYHVGTAMGMELVNVGNTISSATDKWEFDIAEGCSGIRSLMALLMIAAIYAYYSQKEFWKKAFMFAMAFPLALVGNFFRVFTILVLAEMGFDKFAANAYHDYAGLLFFFPAALLGLFLTDRLLNFRRHRKKVKVRQQA
ncbi:hypothetical protein Rhal01_02844 [Rubritalea halochordaticola]|uniref:Exosortase/archaeosortase family protein n=1 Tax=Rubritalea halochordaticola TaxID=714537 RepID=A0ABP9V401_9BACT